MAAVDDGELWEKLELVVLLACLVSLSPGWLLAVMDG